MKVELSSPEWLAVVEIVRSHAKANGEDVLGSILKTSGHRLLADTALVDLARKIDETDTSWSRPEWPQC